MYKLADPKVLHIIHKFNDIEKNVKVLQKVSHLDLGFWNHSTSILYCIYILQ